MLTIAILLAGCGIGGSAATQAVTTDLVTATTTRPPATATTTAPPPATPTAAPSATAVATPTATHALMSAMPSHTPAAGPTVAETPAASVPAQGVVEVRIIDFAFDPPLVEIPVGTTVVWRLVQGYHTVASADFRLDSPILENVGDTYSYTFTEAGSYDYICGIHPEMIGLVRVLP